MDKRVRISLDRGFVVPFPFLFNSCSDRASAQQNPHTRSRNHSSERPCSHLFGEACYSFLHSFTRLEQTRESACSRSRMSLSPPRGAARLRLRSRSPRGVAPVQLFLQQHNFDQWYFYSRLLGFVGRPTCSSTGGDPAAHTPESTGTGTASIYAVTAVPSAVHRSPPQFPSALTSVSGTIGAPEPRRVNNLDDLRRLAHA